MIIKTCVICNDPIKGKSKKYCSARCRMYHPYNKVCIECGNEYHPYKGQESSQFCMRKCYWDYRNKHPDTIFQSNQEKTKYIEHICIQCNNTFHAWNYRKSVQFCSMSCKANYGRVTIKCKTCKNSFTTQKHIGQIYCSNDCAMKGIGKRKSKFAITVENILKSNFHDVLPEYPIKDQTRSIWVDFMVNKKIVIECNGDYWHCNPNRYAPDYYHTQIRKTAKDIWERDAIRKSFITGHGFISIFIWESELKEKNFNLKLIDKIKKALNEIQ